MDEKIFKKIIHFADHYRVFDKLMILVSNKIRYVFLFVLVIMWFRSKKPVAKNFIFTVLFSMMINKMIKLFYYKPRPFVNHRVGILIPSKEDSSFPSKHTILAFALSTSIFLRDRILGTVMYGLSLLTGFSRIWIGHHYPSDIIGSAVIGSIISFFIDRFSNRDITNMDSH